MNKQFGRLLLAGACILIAAASSRGADEPSHRLIPSDFGDLSQAQDLLARRLNHNQELQRFQDLLKGKDLQNLLKEFDPDDIEKIREGVKNNPGLLDDPRLHDLLNKAEQFKQNKGAGLSASDQKKATDLAKELIGQSKSLDSSSDNPVKGGSPEAKAPWSDLPPASEAPSPPVAESDAVRHDFAQDFTDKLKEIGQSPEGEKLRADFLSDLDKPNAGSSGSSSTTDFFERLITPEQAAWLTHNLKLPSLSKFDGWFSHSSLPVAAAGPAAPSDGGMEPGVWVVALALFGIAGCLALRAAKRQADGRAKAWSAGPWPVHPSRVSTREDLIRAFEHLALLCLGPAARHLNHIDVAGRLGETAGGRAGHAARLARLYEPARYAPAHELLPAGELAAARGDLAALAGAAA